MRIHYRRRFQPKPLSPVYRANDVIKSPEVRVIDEEGVMLGVLKTADAIKLAEERELDLVEVSPLANPPVCKLIDFGAFKYQKEKERRIQKAHAKKVDVKGIRLSVKMGAHDIDVRKSQALHFLEEGHKLKIDVILRGREKAHGELAGRKIEDFITSLRVTYPLNIEQPVTRQGNMFSAIVGRSSTAPALSPTGATPAAPATP